MDTLMGQQVGRYRILRHLARGGMADVYLAHDLELGRDICLKLMLTQYMRSAEIRARFQREARAAARLQHRHVVQVFDVGQMPDGRPFLAMEYMAGGSLEDLIRRETQQARPFSPVQVLNLLRQVAVALQAIHRAGMVHRDLKPSNILLREDGTLVVADLGIVAVTEATRLTRTGQMLGTPYYMAPEQVRGKALDARADMYAFGVMLYEMLAGQRPFSGQDRLAVLDQHLRVTPPPLEQVRPGLAPATVDLVNTCLHKEPEGRFPDMVALLAQLDLALAQEQGEATPARTAVPAAGWAQYRWALAGAAIMLVIFLSWLGLRAIAAGEAPLATSVASNRLAAETAVSTTQDTISGDAPVATSTLQAALPTNTPRPTSTPTPTPTPEPTATATAVPTRVILVITPAPTLVTLEVLPACQLGPGDRWGTTLYAQYEQQLGCPLNQENRPNAAYQRYQNGLAVWREDADRVYFLYDNSTYASFAANTAPQGYYDSPLLKGAFGYFWNTNADVRSRLGNPLEAEANASQFAVQDFRNGLIFYFYENGARNYVLFATTGGWVARAE